MKVQPFIHFEGIRDMNLYKPLNMNLKIKLLALFLLVDICREARAQPSVLFEVGTTYFTNDFEVSKSRLPDFFAFTFNTRLMLRERENSAFSIDIPVSIRSKFEDEIVSRFGVHVPVLLTFNIGAGASSLHSEKKIGALLGAGWGYFYQEAKSKNNELPQYKESVSVFGPEVQAGVRIPLRTVSLFRIKDKEINPAVSIRVLHHFDLKDQRHNVGSISVSVGFAF